MIELNELPSEVLRAACDALRAQVDKLTQERDHARGQLKSWQHMFGQVVEAKTFIVGERDHHRMTLRRQHRWLRLAVESGRRDGMDSALRSLEATEPWLTNEKNPPP